MTILFRSTLAAIFSAAAFAIAPLPALAIPDPATPSVKEALENARDLIKDAREFTVVMPGQGPYSFIVHALYRLEDEGFDLEDPATYTLLGTPRAELNTLTATNLVAMVNKDMDQYIVSDPGLSDRDDAAYVSNRSLALLQDAMELTGCKAAPETCNDAIQTSMKRAQALKPPTRP